MTPFAARTSLASRSVPLRTRRVNPWQATGLRTHPEWIKIEYRCPGLGSPKSNSMVARLLKPSGGRNEEPKQIDLFAWRSSCCSIQIHFISYFSATAQGFFVVVDFGLAGRCAFAPVDARHNGRIRGSKAPGRFNPRRNQILSAPRDSREQQDDKDA
jgi:hypothetical protein